MSPEADPIAIPSPWRLPPLTLVAFTGFFALTLWMYRLGEMPYYQNPDPDPFYATQTLSLLSAERLQYTHHPGGVVYAGMALALKLALTSEQRAYLEFGSPIPADPDKTDAILHLAVRTGRYLSVVFGLLMAVLVFSISRYVVGTPWVPLALALYFISCDGLFVHFLQIRPDLPANTLLLMGTVLIGCGLFRSESARLTLFLLAGVCFGLAFFTKIQIAASIAAIGLLSLVVLIARNEDTEISPRRPGLILTILCVLATPWWLTNRPEFVNQDYVNALGGDYIRTYLGLPLDVRGPIWMLLYPCVAVAALRFTRFGSWKAVRAFGGFYGWIYLGFCLSSYLVMLPSSASWRHYWESTNHLIYASFTNLLGGGFLEAEKPFLQYFPEIVDTQRVSMPFFLSSFPEIVLLALVSVTVWLGLFRKDFQALRKSLQLALPLFLFGFAVDWLSASRGAGLPLRYVIFSNVFYLLSFVSLFGSMGIKDWKGDIRKPWLALVAILFVAGFLHNLSIWRRQEPRDRNYEPSWEMIRVHTPSFYARFYHPLK